MIQRISQSDSREKKKLLKSQEKDVKKLTLWEKENIKYKTEIMIFINFKIWDVEIQLYHC